jgi:hypothetical protein
MPMATTSQVLYDGARNLVMQFTGISDGSNETAAVKVDVSELSPAAKSVKITHITYDVSGGILQLLWAANEPVPFLLLTDVNTVDYESIGGMPNGGDDTANGDILFSTLGFEAGSSYSITLEMTKKFP